jgi:hypothetical protein
MRIFPEDGEIVPKHVVSENSYKNLRKEHCVWLEYGVVSLDKQIMTLT